MENILDFFTQHQKPILTLLGLVGILILASILKELTKLPKILVFPASFLVLFFVKPTIYFIGYIALIVAIKLVQSKRIQLINFSLKKDNPNTLKFRTNNGILKLENPYRGIYIQGGAGSGKSLSLINNLIKYIVTKNYSGIIYDFKSPELTRLTFKLSESYQSSIKPLFIDFKDAKQSVRCNPLEPRLMTKTAYASEYAQTLMYNLNPQSIKNQDYWTNEAKSLLTGVIWYLKKVHPQYCTLPHIISLILYTDIKPLIEEVFKTNEAAGFVASLRQAFNNDASKQVAGVLSTLQSNLSKLNTPDIFWILSGNELDLDINNKENPKLLCIGNESTLADTYAPVISLIISVAAKQMNQPNKHKSFIMMDEAPTLYIPNLEQIPATARSNKVATVYACQDFSQLTDRYGSEKAQVILSNMGNQFFGRTVNKNTGQMISQLFGREDKEYTSSSQGESTGSGFLSSSNYSKNKSKSFQERDRVKSTDIMNLKPGEFYGFIAEGNKPEILKSKFKVDKELIDANYIFTEKTSDRIIEDNYNKIIHESKTLFSPKSVSEKIEHKNTLLKF